METFQICLTTNKQITGRGGGGVFICSSIPRRLKFTGFIDISHLSSYAKWLIFEINGSKITVFGHLNYFIFLKLKNEVDERFPLVKIYYPVNFHGATNPRGWERSDWALSCSVVMARTLLTSYAWSPEFVLNITFRRSLSKSLGGAMDSAAG